MSRRFGLVALVMAVGLIGGPVPVAWGQILAMPLSGAAGGPPFGYAPGPPLAPGEIGVIPESGPTLVDPGTGEPFGAGGLYRPRLRRGLGPTAEDEWDWELLPTGLVYRSYLAGGREPRLGAQFVHKRSQGWLLDATAGGRVGLLRYGTRDPLKPEGWQVDFEGAAFPRITIDDRLDLVATDYRYGVPLSFRRGMVESKFGYYHLSSHLSDEFFLVHRGAVGNRYSRDTLVWGLGLRPTDALRLYAEAGWAFRSKGPSEPWEFQFGIDFSPVEATGCRGAPFLALNGRIREEVDFGGNMTLQAGWQWRGQSGQLLRAGFHYFNGKSDQAQFLNEHEEQIGMGIWYDY
jgi:hypothetical protein